MAIDTSGDWWVGSDAEDIAGFLENYSADTYKIDEFRLARCRCCSVNFRLEADDNEGVARRTCLQCGRQNFICDSGEYWEDAEPEVCRCVKCDSDRFNIGIGFSLYENKQAIKWLYVGVRCAMCGVLGCFAGWKIGYEPSLQLMDQV